MIRQLDILWLRSFLRELGLPQKASAKMQKAGQCLPGFEEPFSRSERFLKSVHGKVRVSLPPHYFYMKPLKRHALAKDGGFACVKPYLYTHV